MVAAALALFVVLAGAGPASAAAPRDSGLLLTIAARSWPTYSDITANLARNNIMESLRDLGADTPYRHGEPVDPRVERRVQPNCEPLPDWRFTLGSGYQIRAVAGPWGALSIVRNPFATPIVTQNSTDLLDPQGLPTGKSIGGATTIRLSAAEGELASKRSQSRGALPRTRSSIRSSRGPSMASEHCAAPSTTSTATTSSTSPTRPA